MTGHLHQSLLSLPGARSYVGQAVSLRRVVNPPARGNQLSAEVRAIPRDPAPSYVGQVFNLLPIFNRPGARSSPGGPQ